MCARHTRDPALQDEVLAAGPQLVDARILRHVPDRPSHGIRLAHHVVSAHRCHAFVGSSERHEDADGRRLARAVRPEEREDLAFAHLKRDAVERLHVAVVLPEAVDGDRIHRRRD
jgi:hypothetical protein